MKRYLHVIYTFMTKYPSVFINIQVLTLLFGELVSSIYTTIRSVNCVRTCTSLWKDISLRQKIIFLCGCTQALRLMKPGWLNHEVDFPSDECANGLPRLQQ